MKQLATSAFKFADDFVSAIAFMIIAIICIPVVIVRKVYKTLWK